MKKRLFALLLAAVMVLGLAVTAFGEGQTAEQEQTGTEAAQTAADQAAQTAETTADVTEETEVTEDSEATGDAEVVEDAEVTEDGEVTEDAETTEDAEVAEDTEVTEDAEDEGEPAPLAEDEAQAAAATDVTVTITNNTGRELTITLTDGTTFQSGGKVPQEESGWYVLQVSPAGRDIGVTIEDGAETYYTKVQNGEILFSDRNGDGAVTLTLDQLSGFQLYVKSSVEGVTCAITDPLNGNETVADGGWVYVPSVTSRDVPLNTTLGGEYAFDAGPDFVHFDPDSSSNNNLLVADSNGDKKVTLTVVKALRLHIETSEELVYVSSDHINTNPYQEGAELTAGETFYAAVKEGFAVEAVNAAAAPDEDHFGFTDGYSLDPETGELTRVYDVTPDGTGDVTVRAVPTGDKAPFAVVHITYKGDGFRSEPEKQYTFHGEIFDLDLMPDYGLLVNGSLCSDCVVAVPEGVTELVIETVKLSADAKLAVVGDASALVGSYDGEKYLLNGGTLTDGSGYILVKNGYTIDEAATKGGGCYSYGMMGEPNAPIYYLYHVLATSDTVTVTVKKADPARWVKVRLVNDYPDQVSLETYLDETSDGTKWFLLAPEYFGALWTVGIYTEDENGSVEGFSLAADGCEIAEEEVYEYGKWYSLKVNDGVDEMVVRVALDTDLEAQAPGEPAAGTPGVADKAETEEKLLDTAENVVESAVKGKTPAGVTKDEAAAIADAAAAGQTITTQLVAEAVQSPSDAAAIEKAAGEDATVAQYVDAQILVKADGETIGKITQTEEPIQLAVVLSQEQLDKGLIFFVVRSHEGKTDILPATVNGNVLTFSTDKFSTFGVAYTSDISYATVNPIPDQKWTGEAITPQVTVTANGKTLTAGTDYEVSYENNTDAGTAKVIITGKDPYTGTKTVSFKIVKAASSGTDSGSGSSSSESGAPKTGDETPLALYAGLLTLGLAGLGLVLGRKKRTNK